MKGYLRRSNMKGLRRVSLVKGLLGSIKSPGLLLNSPENVRVALLQLRRGGPLLAVIRISRNYHDCYKSGLIYRFDPNEAVTLHGERLTHAVAVVSFGMEAKVPVLECQDSRGERFSRNGFLAVDITSVKELYSIRVRLSS